MKLQLPKIEQIRQAARMRDIPFLFERYELLIVIGGVSVVFLIGGFLFYEQAYKTVRATPDVVVEVPKIEQALFYKTLEELARKKQPPPDAPIIDPFR